MASRFWVGGSANWDASTTTNWAATSGGAGGASVPTNADDVIFDTLSNATAYTVTITATSNCLSLTIGNPLVGVITLAGTSSISIAGNLAMATGMTNSYTGNISMTPASGTKTITSNGVTLGSTLTLIASGATVQLADNLTISGAKNFTNTSGTFDANGKTVTFIGTAHTITPTAAITFYNLVRTPSSPAKTDTLTLAGNITVSNLFTVSDGATVTNRVLIQSNTVGTARTITSASNSIENADFQDITGAGAGSWNLSAITGLSGDCGGNSGITFTTADDNYWIGGTGSWSTVGEWSQSSGGAANGRVPLPQDTAIFDANSFSAGSQTVTQDMPRIPTTNWTGVTNTPTWTTSTSASVFGSITLVSGMTLTASTQTYTFEGRSSNTLTSAGKSWAKIISLNAPGGSLVLQDALTTTITLTQGIQVRAGTLDANSFNVTTRAFGMNYTLTRGIIMGSGTWEITGNSVDQTVVWNVSAGATITANTSTLKFTNSTASAAVGFTGGSFSYNNIWFAPSASVVTYTVNGNNTFNDFKDDGSVAHSILFAAGSTQTVTTFTVTGNGAGNEITLNSTTTATHTITAPSKSNASPISCDYLNIQHSVATQANTWYAGANSINNQATATAGSGWVFSAPVVVGTARKTLGLLGVG